MSATADDLEALFDQVAAQSAAKVVVKEEVPAEKKLEQPKDMFQRVGELTRTLHDALRELGYDRSIEQAVSGLPDARDRLGYIAKLTGQAADRALAAVEKGQACLKAGDAERAALAAKWDKLFDGKSSVEEFKALAAETRACLKKDSVEAHAQFSEVMMAQDFHDLTGQVINRMVTMAQCLEQQLLQLLLESRPEGAPAAANEQEWLTGPAMNAEGRTDVVANQAQVDNLLESLGF